MLKKSLVKVLGSLALLGVTLLALWPQPAPLAPVQPETLSVGDYYRIYTPRNLSRADIDPVGAYVDEYLAGMTLEQKIRTLLMLSYPGTDIDALAAFMATYQPGGFILMSSNIGSSPEETNVVSRALNYSAELPVLLATDEEGGEVVRLPWDTLPAAGYLGEQPVSETQAVFAARGELLMESGINLNFGIVADVGDDANSFIYARTFGPDPANVAAHVVAAVEGEHSSVASTLKHFPGHGSVTGDSHTSIPVSQLPLSQWLNTDAIPFQQGINAGAHAVMFAHIAFSEVDGVPASLSPFWHELLRDKLGFTGVMITDDMTMLQDSGLSEYSDATSNALSAVKAGNDLLLYVLGADPTAEGVDIGSIVAGLMSAVENGTLSSSQVDASARRVLMLRRSFAPDAYTWLPPCDLSCFVWPES